MWKDSVCKPLSVKIYILQCNLGFAGIFNVLSVEKVSGITLRTTYTCRSNIQKKMHINVLSAQKVSEFYIQLQKKNPFPVVKPVTLVHLLDIYVVCCFSICVINLWLAFPESVLLRQHMEFHEGIRKFRCETCGKAFEKVHSESGWIPKARVNTWYTT